MKNGHFSSKEIEVFALTKSKISLHFFGGEEIEGYILSFNDEGVSILNSLKHEEFISMKNIPYDRICYLELFNTDCTIKMGFSK